MVKNITGGCSECNGTGMSGGSINAPIAGGARRKQFHMLQDKLGVDTRRQNQVVNSLETLQQRPNVPAVMGSGMGFRDPAVRMAHRDRARVRSMEDPRYSQWRGSGMVEGGGWWGDTWNKVKNEFVSPDSTLRSKILPAVYEKARPLVEKVGNQLGKEAGLGDNLGTYADQGLKLIGKGGRKGRSKAKLGVRELKKAMDSGKAYKHDKKWWVGGSEMSDDDMKEHVMRGGGFWGDVWNGVKKVGRKVVAPVGNALGSLVGMPIAGTLADQGLKLAGLGRPRGGKRRTQAEAETDSDTDNGSISDNEEAYNVAEGAGRRHKAKRSPMGASDGRRKRNEIVRKVMAEKGLKMIQASKYVKEHNLYTPA